MNNNTNKGMIMKTFSSKALAVISSGLIFGSIATVAHAFTLNSDNNISKNAHGNLILVGSEKKAEEFINKMGMTAVDFLSNASLTPEQKQKEFKKLLSNNFDMATIGRFALGKNWNLATPSEQKEYLRLFKKMVVEVYSKRFDDYQGQKFEVKSSRPIGSKSDSLVSTLIVPDSGPKIDVDWRVRNKNGKLQIIDVVIEGVSMSLTQRSDFSSVIQRGGGKIEPLLVHLRK